MTSPCEVECLNEALTRVSRGLASNLVVGRLLIALFAASCGLSAVEIQAAKTATYVANQHQMLKLAVDAAEDEFYEIGAIDEAGHFFVTRTLSYTLQGDGPGIAGAIVDVAFMVEVTTDSAFGHTTVVVTPNVSMCFRHRSCKRFAPHDPELPSWVQMHANALAVAIYRRAGKYVAACAAPLALNAKERQSTELSTQLITTRASTSWRGACTSLGNRAAPSRDSERSATSTTTPRSSRYRSISRVSTVHPEQSRAHVLAATSRSAPIQMVLTLKKS